MPDPLPVLRIAHAVPARPVIDAVGDYQGVLLKHFAKAGVDISACTVGQILAAPANAFDIIHFQFPMRAWRRMPFLGLVYPLIRLRHPKARIVTTPHEWLSLNPLRRIVLAPSLMASDLFICPTADVGAEIAAEVHRLTGRAPRIATIPIAPNLDVPDTLPPPRGDHPLTIGHFGFLYEPKLPLTLAAAMIALTKRRPDIRFRLVGSFISNAESLRRRFEAAIAPIRGNIEFDGYVDSQARCIELLCGCDVFLGLHDRGFTARNGSMMTCLFLGHPVVTSAHKNGEALPAWLNQFVAEGRLRFVENGAPPEAIADAVLSAAGLRLPPANVTPASLWRDIVAAHLEIYRALIKAR